MPQNPSYAEPAVAVAFSVVIDSDDLGYFNSCEGLGAEVVMEQREEGGNNGFVWQLPTRVKYSNIKLSRPICSDTTKVIAWLAGVTAKLELGNTAVISVMTAQGSAVASWELMDVVPVRWTGPSLSLDATKVAVETLEIAHHGFVPKPGGRP